MGVFQTTFSFSLQVTGSPVASEWPVPLGPRNWVQLSAATAPAVRQAETSKITVLRMASLKIAGAEGGRRVGGRTEPVYGVAPPPSTITAGPNPVARAVSVGRGIARNLHA